MAKSTMRIKMLAEKTWGFVIIVFCKYSHKVPGMTKLKMEATAWHNTSYCINSDFSKSLKKYMRGEMWEGNLSFYLTEEKHSLFF